MSQITKDMMIDFLRERRNEALNHQAVITNKTSEVYQQLVQGKIDAYNAIIDYISLEINEFYAYQRAAMRTANNLTPEQLILNGVLGLNGEAGEIADLYKKASFQGHELDKHRMIEEVGDLLWYCAILAQGLGVTLNEVANMNIAKLKRRYPNGFDSERSKNRESEKK